MNHSKSTETATNDRRPLAAQKMKAASDAEIEFGTPHGLSSPNSARKLSRPTTSESAPTTEDERSTQDARSREIMGEFFKEAGARDALQSKIKDLE